MNNLGTLQATAKAAIEAAPWFVNVPVIIDNGDVDGAISNALQSPGLVVVIGLPLTVKPREQTNTKTYSDAILDVDLMANPTATVANIPEGLGELIKALAGYPQLPQRDGFEIGEALAQSLSDGLLHWTLPISRRVSLAA